MTPPALVLRANAGRLPSALLRFRTVVVPDWPEPFPYGLDQTGMARAVVEALSLGLADREAWAFCLGDQTHLTNLRSVWGNRKGPRKFRAIRRTNEENQGDLFDGFVEGRHGRDVVNVDAGGLL